MKCFGADIPEFHVTVFSAEPKPCAVLHTYHPPFAGSHRLALRCLKYNCECTDNIWTGEPILRNMFQLSKFSEMFSHWDLTRHTDTESGILHSENTIIHHLSLTPWIAGGSDLKMSHCFVTPFPCLILQNKLSLILPSPRELISFTRLKQGGCCCLVC